MILNTLQEQLEIIQAAIDGKEIQVLLEVSNATNSWVKKSSTMFAFTNNQYRVKPIARTWNASVSGDTLFLGHVTSMEHITVVELLKDN